MLHYFLLPTDATVHCGYSVPSDVWTLQWCIMGYLYFTSDQWTPCALCSEQGWDDRSLVLYRQLVETPRHRTQYSGSLGGFKGSPFSHLFRFPSFWCQCECDEYWAVMRLTAAVCSFKLQVCWPACGNGSSPRQYTEDVDFLFNFISSSKTWTCITETELQELGTPSELEVFSFLLEADTHGVHLSSVSSFFFLYHGLIWLTW